MAAGVAVAEFVSGEKSLARSDALLPLGAAIRIRSQPLDHEIFPLSRGGKMGSPLDSAIIGFGPTAGTGPSATCHQARSS